MPDVKINKFRSLSCENRNRALHRADDCAKSPLDARDLVRGRSDGGHYRRTGEEGLALESRGTYVVAS